MPGKKKRIAAALEALRAFSGATVLMHAAVAERAGLAMTDHKCLEILMREGPIPAGRLAARSRLTSGAITGVVDRLERAQLVVRRADPADRRRVVVEPQRARALALFGPIFEEIATKSTRLLNTYSAEQLETILDFVTRATTLSEGVAESLAEQ